ncbi:TRAP transporter small permease subunit [Thiorhodospira sibirica]|uniref:TRAP transporter small permease subunit n=1 Tax=Thiorhodospira sibirica TaxID=154347 RepID=UPI00022C046A|nr:TRAP transporter small permease subunit [Thiorhodospira sibirica]
MYRLILWIERPLARLTGLAAGLAGVAMLLLVLLVFGNMAARYSAGMGTMWLQELEWHLLALVTLLGISYAMRHDDHVRVDIFSQRLRRVGRLWLDLLTMLGVAIPVALLLLYYTWPFVELSYLRGETSPNAGGMPWRFIPKGLMLIGFFLVLTQAMVRALGCIRRLWFHYRVWPQRVRLRRLSGLSLRKSP